MPHVQLLSQRDPKWENLRLGASVYTIGKDGCLVVSLCMLSSYFGKIITPDMVALQAQCFDLNGEYLWNYKGFPFTKEASYDTRNDAAILQSLKDPKRGVVIQVDSGYHFVLGMSKNWLGSYNCADPWWGDECDAVKRWHNITGSRHLILK